MPKLLHVLHDGPRVESGPVQFGNDWPGVFLRGDNAMMIAMTIDLIVAGAKERQLNAELALAIAQLAGLASDLRSCDVRTLEAETCEH